MSPMGVSGRPFLWLLFRVLVTSIFANTFCYGFLVNATIDDASPDPRTGESIVYSPSGGWRDGRIPCSGCTARPTPELLYNRTWHDSTFNPVPGSNDFPNTPMTASVKFNGTAVYIYCALARTVSGPTGYSDMTFFLDGSEIGTFVKNPPGTAGFDYDVLVYHNSSLPMGNHNLVIQNGKIDGPKALILLDRIVYSYDNGLKSETQEKQELAAILGGSLGGLGFLCILAVGFAFWYFRIRKRRKQQSSLDLSSTGIELPRSPETVPNTSYYSPGHWVPSHSPPTAASITASASNSAGASTTHGPWDHRRDPSDDTAFNPYAMVHQQHAPVTNHNEQLPGYYDDPNQPRQPNIYRKGG